jgi:alpha-1,2-mannosyltransferase
MAAEESSMSQEPSLAGRIGKPVLAGVAAIWIGAVVRDWVTLARFAFQDLQHFRQGGEFVRQGLSPYTAAFTDTGNHLPYIYPPLWALVFAPLSLVPFTLLKVAWTLASLVALWALVSISLRSALAAEPGDRRRRAAIATVAALLAVALGPVSEVLYFGQIGLFVVLACVLDAVILAERNSRFRGVLVGVATAVKLTPGLVIVHWLITRQWRAAITASATTLACWAVSAVLLPSEVRDYFFGGTIFGIAGRVGAERISNQSIFGLLTRLLGEAPSNVPYGVLAVAAACIGLWLARRAHVAGNLMAAISTVGLTSLLVAPMSWQHHAIWVIPAIGVVIGDGRQRARLFGGLAAFLALYSPTQGAQVAALVGFTEFWNLMYLVLIVAMAWIVRDAGGRGVDALRRGPLSRGQPQGGQPQGAQPQGDQPPRGQPQSASIDR